MPRRRQKQAGRRLAADELRAQEGLELPDRHAMSLLSGMPSLDGGGLLGAPTGGGATPTDGGATGGATPDAGTTSDPGPTGTTQTFAPVNRATVLNQLSNGTTQTAGSTQTAPITQSN
ncbi:MAG TPA: hypothetical protein VGL23_01900 [Chloroflexota bacterium]|jgi:hypothetical protein